MTREEKAVVIDELKNKLSTTPYIYLADASSLSVEVINKFRRMCYQRNVEFFVVKNTFLQKAMEQLGSSFDPLHAVLSGPTSVLLSDTGNIPAKLLKDFRKSTKKPVLKAAYIDSAIYIGDDQLDALTAIKSKHELIGEIVGLLQSPAKNVISALKSGGTTIAGIVKTLQERNN